MKGLSELGDELLSTAREKNLGGEVRTEEPLASHTSLRVGGPAEIYVLVRKEEELRAWIGLAQELAIAYRVIGGGTNLLVSDRGIQGLVIENRMRSIRVLEEEMTVVAASGVSLANLGRRLAKEGWGGLEWGSAIPGTVGGAVVNNAGAFGSAVAETIESILLLGAKGEQRELTASQLGFAYRTSVLKGKGSMAGTVFSATFHVQKGKSTQLLQRIAEMDEHRRRTQPKEASVGSIFKNPPADFAGRMIEAAGLKGETAGRAQISPLHANFFVNLGGARAQDILALIRRAREKVADKFGVLLELEIEPVGEWEPGELQGVIP